MTSTMVFCPINAHLMAVNPKVPWLKKTWQFVSARQSQLHVVNAGNQPAGGYIAVILFPLKTYAACGFKLRCQLRTRQTKKRNPPTNPPNQNQIEPNQSFVSTSTMPYKNEGKPPGKIQAPQGSKAFGISTLHGGCSQLPHPLGAEHPLGLEQLAPWKAVRRPIGVIRWPRKYIRHVKPRASKINWRKVFSGFLVRSNRNLQTTRV